MTRIKPKQLAEKLTGKQSKWLNFYFATNFNATEAARLAQYKGNYQTLASIGHENLKKLELFVQQRLKEHHLSADEALARLSGIATGDVLGLLEVVRNGDDEIEKVHPSLVRAVERSQTHLIKEIGYDTKGNLKIKLHDTQKALETLLKVHGKLGPKGTEDDPVMNVAMSLDEWKARAAARTADIEGKLE